MPLHSLVGNSRADDPVAINAGILGLSTSDNSSIAFCSADPVIGNVDAAINLDI